MTAQTMQIGNRPCRICGEAYAEYLLLQMTGEHELQSMESEIAAIAQSAHHFLFAAILVESWNDALSPWMESETFRLQVRVRFVFCDLLPPLSWKNFPICCSFYPARLGKYSGHHRSCRIS